MSVQQDERPDGRRVLAIERDLRDALRSITDIVIGPDSRAVALREFMNAMEPIVLEDGRVLRNRALMEAAALALYRRLKAEGAVW